MSFLCHVHAARDEPLVALTFDDGPNPPATDQVLDVLAQWGARATFLVIGRWVERWPETARRILREDHEVGNHTLTHQRGTGDYDAAEQVIARTLGTGTCFARAPAFDYGSCAQSELLRSGRLQLVDADVNPADWDCDDAGEIARRVLESPRLQGGSIIDLHDGYDRDDNAVRLSRPRAMLEALSAILNGLCERRLRPVTLSEMRFGAPVPVEVVQRDEVHVRAQQAAQQ